MIEERCVSFCSGTNGLKASNAVTFSHYVITLEIVSWFAYGPFGSYTRLLSNTIHGISCHTIYIVLHVAETDFILSDSAKLAQKRFNNRSFLHVF